MRYIRMVLLLFYYYDLLDFETARDRPLEEWRPEQDGLWMLMIEAMYLFR